ncbi:MAG: hypothetical protein AABX66_02210 [Nanoarchaeota archaeon]
MNRMRIGLAIVLVLAIVYSAYGFYQISKNTAQAYAPTIYTQQWQKAMEWVRENTSPSAVFGHWWDYGYWVQSIGKRATVLDGGNYYGYWNHLMGRYALTGTSNEEALSFLYSHNTTHFLIDSTDIGKYGAFSSIGSGTTNDRMSFIPTLYRDSSQKKETKNGTILIYPGGFGLDEDIIYEQNGSKIFLPASKAGVVAVLLEFNNQGELIEQPQAVFVYQNKQYQLPMRYAYQNTLRDFGSGIEAGVFVMPRIINGQQFDKNGAVLYLSKRTVNSQLARLYLYNEQNPYFKLVHVEDDFGVAQLKEGMYTNSSFVDYGGFRGPIKIWEINYPAGMKVNESEIRTEFPDSKLNQAL